MKQRVEWIDILKGISICAVVFSHCVYGDNISPGLFKAFSWYFSIYMQVFFALSGYFFLYQQRNNYGTLIKRRFRTLMIPYFIWGVLIGLSASYLPSILRGQSLDYPKLLIETLTLQNSSAAAWFLEVLFGIYLLEFLLSSLKNKPHDFFLFMIHILFMITGILIKNTYAGNLFRITQILQYSYYFFLGYLFRQMSVHINTDGFRYTLLSVIILIAGILPWIFIPAGYARDFISATVSLFGVLMISQAIFRGSVIQNHLLTNLLSAYGRNSIVILCTHVLILLVIHKIQLITGISKGNVYPLLSTFIIIMIIETILIKADIPLLNMTFGRFSKTEDRRHV